MSTFEENFMQEVVKFKEKKRITSNRKPKFGPNITPKLSSVFTTSGRKNNKIEVWRSEIFERHMNSLSNRENYSE